MKFTFYTLISSKFIYRFASIRWFPQNSQKYFGKFVPLLMVLTFFLPPPHFSPASTPPLSFSHNDYYDSNILVYKIKFFVIWVCERFCPSNMHTFCWRNCDNLYVYFYINSRFLKCNGEWILLDNFLYINKMVLML